MANVLFKRGLQSQLPASGSAVDGALYFTTDSKRLFLGLEDKTLIPIAEGITSVNNAIELPAAAAHAGEFYYIAPSGVSGDAAGNILAYSDGSKWLQVNMSTYITSATETVAVSDNDATITLQTTDNQNGHVTTAFHIVGGDNVTLTTSEGNLVISVPDDKDTLYTISTVAGAASGAVAGGSQTVAINLVPTANTGNGVDTSTVTFKETDSIGIKRGADGSISFEVKEAGVSGIKTFTASTLSEGFNHIIETSAGGTFSASINPTIAYGFNGTGTSSTVHFVDGTATLSVYTKSEIDTALGNLQKNMDAMEYRGTASTITDLTGLHDIENGNAWKANGTFTIPAANSATGSAIPVEPGYLIIAQPKANTSEDEDGYLTDPVFDVVAGDVDDTQYKFASTTHGVLLQTSDGTQTVGTFTLSTVSGNLTLTDSGEGSTMGVTIDLADVTAATSTGTALTQEVGSNLTFQAVTGVQRDSKGRVTNVETTTITVVDTKTASVGLTDTISAANNVATISQQIDIDDLHSSATFSLASAGNSIAVTASNNTVNVDLVWGSFQ